MKKLDEKIENVMALLIGTSVGVVFAFLAYLLLRSVL